MILFEAYFIFIASQDGYPYSYIDETEHSQWQDFRPSTTSPDDLPECTISFDECFVHDNAPLTRASDVFKHVAFRRPACGDCSTSLTDSSKHPTNLRP